MRHVHDLDKLEDVKIKYDDGNIGEGDYKFRYPNKKAEAILGVIQVL